MEQVFLSEFNKLTRLFPGLLEKSRLYCFLDVIPMSHSSVIISGVRCLHGAKINAPIYRQGGMCVKGQRRLRETILAFLMHQLYYIHMYYELKKFLAINFQFYMRVQKNNPYIFVHTQVK